MTSTADKAAVRASVRLHRNLRDAAEQAAAAEAIARHGLVTLPSGPCTVTAYRSLPGEPGTDPLIASLLEHGHRVLLPRIVGRALEWVTVTTHTEYARGPLGISEPVGPALPDGALRDADALFIPGLGIDHQGWRLGQGGGYYDSTLAAVEPYSSGGPLRVALLYDDEFVPRIPHDDHDCRVDVVVTPQGAHRLEA